MNIREIKEILQLMEDHQLTEIEIEKDGTKIKLRKSSDGRIIAEHASAQQSVAIPAGISNSSATVPLETPAATVQEDANIVVIRSPMVGTFYAAPAPDQPPYVTGGQKVKSGDVLCIVEAMKLMNEIKCEMNGTITEILVSNGQAIEFDQTLFKIRKD